MWKYEDGVWTWISGSKYINSNGVYGQLKISDPSAFPAARFKCSCWQDKNNRFWMFGGFGGSKFQFWEKITRISDYFSDTWMFNGNSWAYWNGPKEYNVPAHYNQQRTFSHENHPGGRYGAAVSLSDDSEVYLMGGSSISSLYTSNEIWKFDPNQGWAYWDKSPLVINSKREAIFSSFGNNLWLYGGWSSISSNTYGITLEAAHS